MKHRAALLIPLEMLVLGSEVIINHDCLGENFMLYCHLGKPSTSLDSREELNRKSPVRTMHNDLDDALAKLQQILATNFMLDGEIICSLLK